MSIIISDAKNHPKPVEIFILIKVKGRMHKSVVRPAMLYGMETVAVTERQMGKIEVAELKMVR